MSATQIIDEKTFGRFCTNFRSLLPIGRTFNLESWMILDSLRRELQRQKAAGKHVTASAVDKLFQGIEISAFDRFQELPGVRLANPGYWVTTLSDYREYEDPADRIVCSYTARKRDRNRARCNASQMLIGYVTLQKEADRARKILELTIGDYTTC
jgi:hypothetical protein